MGESIFTWGTISKTHDTPTTDNQINFPAHFSNARQASFTLKNYVMPRKTLLFITIGPNQRKQRLVIRWAERIRRYQIKTGKAIKDHPLTYAIFIVNNIVKPPKYPKHNRR